MFIFQVVYIHFWIGQWENKRENKRDIKTNLFEVNEMQVHEIVPISCDWEKEERANDQRPRANI